jgi:DNA-binding response OmpR family regulator
MQAKILIVEDEPVTRTALAMLIATHGYTAIVASTFEEGRSLLASESPDLLITDIRLGPSNGLQLVIGLPETSPAIVLTGYADPVLEREAINAGAQYAVKPVEPAALFEMVEHALEARVKRLAH